MRCVRDFDEVRVWARNSEKEKAFADEHGAVSMVRKTRCAVRM
jgi:ornithine cyclodeaminase/alanine dehydrogenase-like protein (mu-crystallin family)